MNLVRGSRWAVPIFLALLSGAQLACAADHTIQTSLHKFFRQGVMLNGAKAELMEVLRWPAIKQNNKETAKGSLRWRLPHLRNHPTRVSLIAEQGKGAQVRRWYVPVQLRWWADALVVRDDVAARTLLMASMLQHAHANVTDHPGHWWTDARQLVGTRTTRPLRAGQVVYTSYVKRPPLLVRGDHVMLVSSIGGIRVTAIGKVLKQGGRGDRVRVQNLSSKRVLQATIVDKHTARVLTGGA